MRSLSPHWGPVSLGAESQRDRSSIRVLISSQLIESRIFTERLYRDFTHSGARAFAARLVDGRGKVGKTIRRGRT